MFSAVSIGGYPPERIEYCPRCGNGNIDVWGEKLTCGACGLVCHIIEGESSRAEEYGESE
jgi:hypothetical protein